MSTHRCPGPKCERLVPADMLACRDHWFQVPKPLRHEVWSAWRALQRARPEDAIDAEQRHDPAMHAAIETMWELAT
jgi:hypothetical protein